MRDKWTDERLDDLAAGMHRGFDRVHTEMRSQRTLIIAGFGSIVAGVLGSAIVAILAPAL